MYRRAISLSTLLLALSLTSIACGEGTDDSAEGGAPESAEEGVRTGSERATTVEGGVREIITSGERYADILEDLEEPQDVEEHRDELIEIFAAMRDLESRFSDRQTEIESRLDTNARSVELNKRLRIELMRIAGDSLLARSLAELRASVNGVPVQ